MYRSDSAFNSYNNNNNINMESVEYRECFIIYIIVLQRSKLLLLFISILIFNSRYTKLSLVGYSILFFIMKKN